VSNDVAIDGVFEEEEEEEEARYNDWWIWGRGTLKERRIHEAADVQVDIRSRDPITDAGSTPCVPLNPCNRRVSKGDIIHELET
jgi:hypothetical protein